MTETDGHLGQFEVTAQLFGLIDDMPAEKQYILMKQLIGDRLPVHLMRMVLDMDEARKLDLLKALGQPAREEGSVNTISLDGSNHLMRGMLRKPCRMPVRFRIGEVIQRSVIVDISMEGVFIESKAPPEPGTTIQMAFALPGAAKAFTLSGVVARSGEAGFGVKFKALDGLQHSEIARFVGK